MGAPTVRDAAGTLAEAYHDGALFCHVLPDPRRRAERLPWLFEGALLHCRRHGEVEVVDGVDAVAGWVAGPRLALTPADLVRTGLIAAPARLGATQSLRLDRHERACEGPLLDAVTEATAYLWMLGVRPERRGEGLGAHTVAVVLAAMARLGHRRCLLRTEEPDDVPLYRHLGFEVVEHLTELPSGLPAWIMARSTSV